MLFLLVDDDKPILETMRYYFEQFHCKDILLTASSVGEALDNIHKVKPDAIIIDYLLGGLDASEIVNKLPELFDSNKPEILLISAIKNIEAVAKKLNIKHWLSKPFSLEALESALATLGSTKQASCK